MRAFISYSWDDDQHKDWVRRFADDLIRHGVEVTLDQYDLTIRADRFRFMESSVRDADYVLCVCTPEYVARANEREKGVGVETSLITPQFFKENRSKQFIPIIRRITKGVPHTPDYMSALIYVDFTTDAQFSERLEELLRHMHNQPLHTKPSLGPVPAFKSTSSSPVATLPPAVTPTLGAAMSVEDIVERIRNSDKSEWNYFDERDLFVYRADPRVTIQREGFEYDNPFHELWVTRFPDPVAYRAIHNVYLESTLIHEEHLVSVDGHRMYIPLPASPMKLEISDEQYRFGQFVNKFSPWGDRYDEYLTRAGITVS